MKSHVLSLLIDDMPLIKQQSSNSDFGLLRYCHRLKSLSREVAARRLFGRERGTLCQSQRGRKAAHERAKFFLRGAPAGRAVERKHGVTPARRPVHVAQRAPTE
jgi:hypothetical protein